MGLGWRIVGVPRTVRIAPGPRVGGAEGAEDIHLGRLVIVTLWVHCGPRQAVLKQLQPDLKPS